MLAIKGNAPFDYGITDEHVFTVKDIRMLLTHGHKHKVRKGIETLFHRAKELDVDMVLFGHTHVAYHACVDNIHLMNPGSVGRSRDHLPETYLVLTITDEARRITWFNAHTHEPLKTMTLKPCEEDEPWKKSN